MEEDQEEADDEEDVEDEEDDVDEDDIAEEDVDAEDTRPLARHIQTSGLEDVPSAPPGVEPDEPFLTRPSAPDKPESEVESSRAPAEYGPYRVPDRPPAGDAERRDGSTATEESDAATDDTTTSTEPGTPRRTDAIDQSDNTDDTDEDDQADSSASPDDAASEDRTGSPESAWSLDLPDAPSRSETEARRIPPSARPDDAESEAQDDFEEGIDASDDGGEEDDDPDDPLRPHPDERF
jgi:hypothetical protein